MLPDKSNLFFAVDEKRPSQPLLDDEMKVKRIPLEVTSVGISGEKGARPTWLILLVIAIISLILTVTVGYFVLGPGKW